MSRCVTYSPRLRCRKMKIMPPYQRRRSSPRVSQGQSQQGCQPCLEGIRFPTVHTDTDTPQGTVLAPFLYTYYTSDYKSTDNVYPLVRYADDSVIVGMVNNEDDSGYLREINDFVLWCDDTLYSGVMTLCTVVWWHFFAVKCHKD